MCSTACSCLISRPTGVCIDISFKVSPIPGSDGLDMPFNNGDWPKIRATRAVACVEHGAGMTNPCSGRLLVWLHLRTGYAYVSYADRKRSGPGRCYWFSQSPEL